MKKGNIYGWRPSPRKWRDGDGPEGSPGFEAVFAIAG